MGLVKADAAFFRSLFQIRGILSMAILQERRIVSFLYVEPGKNGTSKPR